MMFFFVSSIHSQLAFIQLFFTICWCIRAGLVDGQCNGSFALTCVNLELTNADTLQADCGDGSGGIISSSLNLDVHVTNTNGVLHCNSYSGKFSLSCVGQEISSSGLLSASCLDFSGNLAGTSFDLNTCVSNIYGSLTWTCLS
ncbi:hypothetical protein KP509_12G041500 [Ceratopteris richardii]|uniref:Cyanovirin-N domain-containing protein n=1 Tax=Ceratopteris richardii TaxID=49495 RepID=A0A8T2TP11_CERRI|nr:hypothetical protein KP509_12G041500 [Ceratopteris richardii]